MPLGSTCTCALSYKSPVSVVVALEESRLLFPEQFGGVEDTEALWCPGRPGPNGSRL